MNSAEFLDWMSRARLMFAHVDELFRYTRQDSPERERMLANEWAMALRDVSADDAGAALDALRDGELKAPGNYRADWSTLPAIVRQHAKDQQAIRESANRREVTPEWARSMPPRKQRTDGGMTSSSELMRRIMGLTEGEAKAVLAAEIPPSDEAKQRRYKCPLCLDSDLGLVEIWRPWCVLYVREHWLEGVPTDWRTQLKAALHQAREGWHFHAHAVCSCESFVARSKREKSERLKAENQKHMPIFERHKFQPFRGGDIAKLIETLTEDPHVAVGAPAWEWGDVPDEF